MRERKQIFGRDQFLVRKAKVTVVSVDGQTMDGNG